MSTCDGGIYGGVTPITPPRAFVSPGESQTYEAYSYTCDVVRIQHINTTRYLSEKF